MLIEIHPDNPSERKLVQVADCLRQGGIIVFPTDTVYALGCDIHNHRAIEKICRYKKQKLEKTNLSFICYDLSNISDFTRQVDTPTYKLMKRLLPGPYTFILPANNNVPSLFRSRKKTIGIRVPQNNIARQLVHTLGNPMMCASLHNLDEPILDYETDPSLIHEKVASEIDMVIDGGYGGNEPSTVIDCTGSEPLIVREGKGFDAVS